MKQRINMHMQNVSIYSMITWNNVASKPAAIMNSLFDHIEDNSNNRVLFFLCQQQYNLSINKHSYCLKQQLIKWNKSKHIQTINLEPYYWSNQLQEVWLPHLSDSLVLPFIFPAFCFPSFSHQLLWASCNLLSLLFLPFWWTTVSLFITIVFCIVLYWFHF